MKLRSKVRELLIDPALERSFSAELHDFRLKVGEEFIPLNATIRCSEDLEITLRDSQGRDLSKFFPGVGIISKKDLLEGEGILGEELRVRIIGIMPPFSSTIRPIGEVSSSDAVAHFDRIELVSSPISGEEREEYDFEHIAIFADIDLKYRNAGVERSEVHPYWGNNTNGKLISWDGDALGGEFSVMQEGDHLKIGFRHTAANANDAMRQARALFSAVGYSQAFLPWPCYMGTSQNGRRVEEFFQARWPAQGKFVPLRRRHVDLSQECPTKLIASVAEWLLGMDDDAHEDIEHALWIFRSSDHRSAPAPLQMAMIGAVIENLMDAEEGSTPPASFSSLRDDAIAWATEIATSSEDAERSGFARGLIGYLERWPHKSRRVQWNECFAPLFPGREAWLKEIFTLYQKFRNPPAHGDFAASLRDSSKLMEARGRLSGFVNLVIAARAGYSGGILESPFADSLIVVNPQDES